MPCYRNRSYAGVACHIDTTKQTCADPAGSEKIATARAHSALNAAALERIGAAIHGAAAAVE